MMLKNKKALITGASRGIGRAIAIEFAKNGATVGINYFKSKGKAREVYEEALKYSNAILLKGDVGSFNEAKNIVKNFIEFAGSIDILVLNAGIYKRKKFHEIEEKDWDETLRVNLKGSFNICKHAIPYINDGGKIIFISSQLAFKGSSHGADYAASKSGLLGLMRSLAIELASKKINVNAIAPGTIDTDIIADYSKEERMEREKQIPLGRIGKPEDVASVALFLASNMANYITGEVILVTGGLYMG